LLGLLGLGCGSSFTASEEDGSAPDATSDGSKPAESGASDTSPSVDGGGMFACGPKAKCETNAQYCLDLPKEDTIACVSTQPNCELADAEMSCDCDNGTVEGQGSVSCACTGSTGQWTLVCVPKKTGTEDGGESDAKVPKDAGLLHDVGLPVDVIKLPP
jgi:hypothetical protein